MVRSQSGRGGRGGSGGRQGGTRNSGRSGQRQSHEPKNDTNKKNREKKTLSDYKFELGKGAAAHYHEVLKYLLNEITKKFVGGDLIVESLETGKEHDFRIDYMDMRRTIRDDIAAMDDDMLFIFEQEEEDGKDDTYEGEGTTTRSKADEIISSTLDKEEKLERQRIAQRKQLFDTEMSQFSKQLAIDKKTYKTNKVQVYSFLWTQCSKDLRTKIESLTDFETNIKYKPINLLKNIRELTNNTQDREYCMAVIHRALGNLINLQMTRDETPHEFANRLTVVAEMVEAEGGGLLAFPRAAELLHGKEADPEVTFADTWERYKAWILIEKAYPPKYGSLIAKLRSEYALRHDQYPTTLLDAREILSAHKPDPAFYEQAAKRNATKNDSKKEKPKPTENVSNESEKPVSLTEIQLAQMEGRCFRCGESGHRSTDTVKCKLPSTLPRSKWVINNGKEMQHMQQSVDDGQYDSTDEAPEERMAWQNVQGSRSASRKKQTTPKVHWGNCQWIDERPLFQQKAGKFPPDKMRNWLLLDSQSTINHFCNKRNVANIRTTDKPITLMTNAGDKINDQVCDVAGVGKAYFDPEARVNIVSLALIEKQYRVTYDSTNESAFLVHTPNGIVKFTRSPEGLYYKTLGDNEGSTESIFVQTVEENLKKYSQRQLDGAYRARELLHALSCPSVPDLKRALQQNAISNCPVSIRDIEVASDIFGPDIASLKGKSTRHKERPYVEDIVTIPPELVAAQQKVHLCIDTFFVNGVSFLATISKHIMYRTCTQVSQLTVSHYAAAVMKVLSTYRSAGFVVSYIHADNEFASVCERVKHQVPELQYELVPARAHQPEAERNNRTIKERIRAVIHSLPFQAIPNIMVALLAVEVTNHLNFFPPRGGISDYYSPRQIIEKRNLDYRRQCAIPMFTYVEATDDRAVKNDMKQRTISALYIRPKVTSSGGFEVLSLSTFQTFSRAHVTPLPMTPSVIHAVEMAAKADNVNKTVIRSKHGIIFYDSSQIAGVDYITSPEDYDDVYADEDYEDEDEEHQRAIEPDLNADEPISDSEIEDLRNDQDLYEATSDTIQDETSQNKRTTRNSQQSSYKPQATNPRRSARKPKPSIRAREAAEHLQSSTTGEVEGQPTFTTGEVAEQHTQATKPSTTGWKPIKTEYYDEAIALVKTMMKLKERDSLTTAEYQNVVTYSLKKGIAKFGEEGRASALKEMKQLHDRECFAPIDSKTLTPTEKKRALESLIFLVQKRDGKIKTRHCANGNPQRKWMDKDEVSSPTVSTDSLFITSAIEAAEGREVATGDIPNAFIQTDLDETDKDGNRTIMKIRGVLVDILCEIDETYKPYVTYEGKQKVLYVHVIKAIYGLLVSAMLFYKKLTKDLIGYGFQLNPYDPCVANKMVEGAQMTVSWHVDDLKVSHLNKKEVDHFMKWINDKYGQITQVTVTRGKIHEYLGMKLDYSEPGKLIVDMRDYITTMKEAFPVDELKGKQVKSPWTDKLFTIDESSPTLSKEMREQFHTTVAQGLFLCKRGRPDISIAIAFLTTRVRAPTQQDWSKLVRMMKWLIQTQDDLLTIEIFISEGKKIQADWYVDAAFAVHPDYRSHTGAAMTMGKGSIINMSRKQSLNTRSSTEAELVAADDAVTPLLWTSEFLEAQGYIPTNILHQDNKSAILLEKNGRSSAGKRSRHLNIRYFFITDMAEKGRLDITYCPTDDMVGDYHTKPLHGKKMNEFRSMIMNMQPTGAIQLFSMACGWSLQTEN